MREEGKVEWAVHEEEAKEAAFDVEAAAAAGIPDHKGPPPASHPGAASLEWHVKDLSIKQRRLLADIAGRAVSGDLLVIMGPSGCGKTSLLECLSLRNRGFTGALHFNGQPVGRDYLAKTSVVYQTEIVHGFLTPREHLTFHALARMSRTHTRAAIAHRVEEVIAELGLGTCADTRIGGAEQFYARKGISGGERKRLMIGTELLFCPQVLFLDEPTSGLDSFMSESVLASLQDVTKHGTMVITSLHSPASSWAKYFTHLLLMTADGRVAYHGPYSQALPYLEGVIGQRLERGTSTGEFVLDTVSRKPGESADKTAARLDQLVTSFKASAYSIEDPLPPDNSHTRISSAASTHASVPTLMMLNVKRNLTECYRNHLAYIIWTMAHAVVGVAVGGLFFQAASDSWRNLMGQFMVVMMAQSLLSAIAGAVIFPGEWTKVVRECLVGRNAVGPFVFGRVVGTQIYAIGSLALPFTSYWLSGLLPSAREFVIYSTACLLVGLASGTVGLFSSSFSSNVLIGVAIVPALLLPCYAFSGLVYQKSAVPSYFRWIEASSLYNYGFSAMMGPQAAALSPQDRAIALGFMGVDPNHWPKDLAALSVIMAAFFLLTYLVIRLRLRLLRQAF